MQLIIYSSVKTDTIRTIMEKKLCVSTLTWAIGNSNIHKILKIKICIVCICELQFNNLMYIKSLSIC